MRNIITLISLLISIQAFAEGQNDITSFDYDSLSFNCKTEKHEELHIKLFKKGGAIISKDVHDNFFFYGGPSSWKELEQGVFEVNVMGAPTKTLEGQFYASARLEISPLGSFAIGSYESGTYGSGFKEVAIECSVSQK